MKGFPVVVSFFTKNTPYEQEVQNLIHSCKKFGLEASIEGVESFGSWELNCSFKPFFLLQKLQELKKSVLWVDADAVFVKRPELLELFSADFAVRINPELSDEHISKVMSGTIFANYTGKAQEILKLWAQGCAQELLRPDRREEFWEQTALRDILLSGSLDADVRSLPVSYVKVAGHPGDERTVPDPVIEHHQASRRFKHLV